MGAEQPTSEPQRPPRPVGYRESRSFPWPDWHEGPWGVELDFAEAPDGRVFCCGVAVRLEDGAESHEMTATLLRSVPLGALVRWHLKQSALWADRLAEMSREAIGIEEAPVPHGVLTLSEGSALMSREWAKTRAGYQAGVSGPRGGRPPKHDEAFYREVAHVYTAALAGGRHPTKAVAEKWGPVSRSLAAKWVSDARNRFGFLGPTTKGRPKGAVKKAKPTRPKKGH